MKSQNAAGLELPQYRAPSICEACGERFICGATLSACWCQEVKLSEEARAHLRARFQNCLCRACLESFAEGEKKNGEKEEQVFTGPAN